MKKYIFLSSVLAVLTAACSNDNMVQDDKQTPGTSGGLTEFVTGSPVENKTRTSMDYTTGAFFWEENDKIYVKDDNGTIYPSSDHVTAARQADFEFHVPGAYTGSPTYTVYYPGKNGVDDQVTIAALQTQKSPNITTHFGEAGDCGIATATKTGRKFKFKLDHKAAYLVFTPHTSDAIFQRCHLTKIEVTSNNSIAGTYTLSPSGLTEVSGSQSITLTTKGSGAYANGFPLNTATDNLDFNGAYMIIAPGTHELTIRYWLKDPVTGTEGTITKGFLAFNYAANNYYDMWGNLDIRSYNDAKYYLWDAKQNYWYQHEWDSADPWQPTQEGWDHSNPNYPQSATSDPDRWHNTITTAATQSAVNCPNVNESYWYVQRGDPHYDTNELFTCMGQLKNSGAWFKKQEKIAAENSTTVAALKNAGPDGTDYRVVGQNFDTPPTLGHPTCTTHYFFLPSFGYYNGGTFNLFGGLNGTGEYWTSSPLGTDSYHMYFHRMGVGVFHSIRPHLATPLWKAE